MDRAAVPLLLLVLVISSCTGSGRSLPDSDEFAAGTCRDAAPALLAIDEQVRAAAGPDVDELAARASLREQQSRLQALSGGAGDLAVALDDVIARVGFARVALDVAALDAEDVADVTAAVDRVVAICVPDT